METLETKQDTGKGETLLGAAKQHRKVKRREFLKAVTIAPLCSVALLEKAQASEAEEEQDLLDFITQHLQEKGIEIRPDESEAMVLGCLVGAEMVISSGRRKEAEQQVLQQAREHRDGLAEQEKLAYVVDQIKNLFQFYSPPYQQEILRLAAEGQQPPEQWKHTNDTNDYMAGRLDEILFGLDRNFKKKVIACYERDVLPELYVRWEEEVARQDACDEFVNLTGDKSAEQVRAMTTQLRNVA